MSKPATGGGEALAHIIFWTVILLLGIFWLEALTSLLNLLLYLLATVIVGFFAHWIGQELWWWFWSRHLLDHRFECTRRGLPLARPDKDHIAMLNQVYDRHSRISEAGACSQCGPSLGVMRRVKAQRRVLTELDAETDAALRALVDDATM